MNTTTETPEVTLPPVRDNRVGFTGEMSRLQAEIAQAREELAAKDQIIAQLRTEEITDGADPRLIPFWEKASRIADHAGFCSEYDRMAEAMNGLRRERDYEVATLVSITVRISNTVTSRDSDGAMGIAEDMIDRSAILEYISAYGFDDWSIDESDVEEA